tara:strand:- start:23646 stop:24431 length:786 start_codon:yes stop_codon:yes gene_type:complete
MLGIAKAISNANIKLMSTTTITSTGSQVYTVPGGTLYVEIEMWGAGGGGGCGDKAGGRGGTIHQAGGGGGGGAYVKHKYYPSNILANDTINFTIGAGGPGATTPSGVNGRGTDGGATTLNTHKRSTTTVTSFNQSAGGGIGGRNQNAILGGSVPDFSAGGDGANGNITNTDGTDGGEIQSGSGSVQDGQAGGAGANGGAGGSGGDADGTGDNYGNNGTAPGGGGGGGASDCTSGVCQGTGADHDGGDGADGKVVVKAYGIG